MPEDPAPQRFEDLRRAVLDYEGTLPVELRRAAFAGDEVPDVLTGYVDKVRRHAYRVTDEDVAALLAAGFSEDQVFELTVAVAAGAGFRRLDAGRRAIAG